MDYRGWTDRARRFLEEFRRDHPGANTRDDIGPPASAARIAAAEAALGRPLPAPFRAFLATASGACDFGYWWEPAGEAEAGAREALAELGARTIAGGLEFFAHADCLADDYEYHKELVEEGAYGDAPFCQDPLPIGGLANGDHIAIDLGGGSVLFLAHDGPSYPLAPDFDTFLARWEAIAYLGFDIGPHGRFVDRDGGGGIDATDRPELRALWGLLRPAG